MKKTLSLLIALLMLITVIPLSAVVSSAGTFTDVPENAYYSDAVEWAYTSGITTGVSKTRFAPESTTTRGQVVTFLWRTLGEPEPETKENPFEDVSASDYFYKAVLWAVEKGITNGTSAKRFSPAVTCTNAHILTFIWRAMGEPEKTGNGEWYEDAVNWANGKGLTDGTYTGAFAPSAQCPRANVVTYLYRYDSSSSILRLFVKNGADSTKADGTYEKPFGTVDAARDYIRGIDKSLYTRIIVRILSGEYQVTEPITFTEKDSGTESCPIIYIGENETSILGGVNLKASDFKKASGGLTEYFPEEARDKIVMVDLTKYGFTAEQIKDSLHQRYKIAGTVPFLSLNGERQTIAEFPNNSFIHVGETVTHSADGTTNTARDGIDLQTVNYGEEYMERVLSWSNVEEIYVIARLYKLWCPDDSRVVGRSKTEPTIDILFAGGHEPDEGTILKFYNIPEELDVPGEYIFDDNGMLYYYPAEGFDTGIITLPASDGIIYVEGASNLTFKNLNLSSSNEDVLHLNGDNLSLIDSKVSASRETGIRFNGNNILITGSEIYNTGTTAVSGSSGNIADITGGKSLIYDNAVYDFGVTTAYGYAISLGKSVDTVIAHNDIYNGNFKGIHVYDSANCTVEYNEVWNVSLLSEDVGVLSADGQMNANVVFRYNYVHDCMPQGEAARIKEVNPDYGYMGTYAFYYDGGCSYIETYGNVVKNVDTGYLSNGGRGNSCHGNLFINCHKWYVEFSEIMYSGRVDSNGKVSGRAEYESYIYSDAWKAANPDLASLATNVTTDMDPLDPSIFFAPTGNTCYGNWIAYNKADRLFTNWGVRPYNIEPMLEKFPNNIQADESLITLYSSKREDISVEELIKNDAAGTIEITLEQFNSIGRVTD